MSLLDPEEELANNFEYEVRKFLDENYEFENSLFSIPYSINIFEGVDGLLVVDVIKGNVYLKNLGAEKLTNGLFRFGEISGGFYIETAPRLNSLEGAPEKCKGFYCANSALITLEGAPKKCVRFSCKGCYSLMSLEGAPRECEEFNCGNCYSLVSLEGAPESCKYFRCDHCMNLKNLKGAPKSCNSISCGWCPKIKSLEGAPDDCVIYPPTFKGEIKLKSK